LIVDSILRELGLTQKIVPFLQCFQQILYVGLVHAFLELLLEQRQSSNGKFVQFLLFLLQFLLSLGVVLELTHETAHEVFGLDQEHEAGGVLTDELVIEQPQQELYLGFGAVCAHDLFSELINNFGLNGWRFATSAFIVIDKKTSELPTTLY
jgi:hypothetical protein